MILQKLYVLQWFWSVPHCHILQAVARGGSNDNRNVYFWKMPWCHCLILKIFKWKLEKEIGVRMEGSQGKSHFLCASWILLEGFGKITVLEAHVHWLACSCGASLYNDRHIFHFKRTVLYWLNVKTQVHLKKCIIHYVKEKKIFRTLLSTA